MAYWSFMQMELVHRHPVLVAFCDLMSQKSRLSKGAYGTIITDTTSIQTSLTIHQQRIQNKWLKAYTLVRNPSLINDRNVFWQTHSD